MTRFYVLSGAAEEDLRGITQHTLEQWGAVQCRTYIAALEAKAVAVAKGEGVFKDMSSLIPGLRVATSGKHYIFCLSRPNALPIILAILHERMDIMARLKGRL